MLLSLHLCQPGAVGGFNRSFTQTLARHVFVVVECRHDLNTTINPAVRQNNGIRPHFVAYLLQGLSHGLRKKPFYFHAVSSSHRQALWLSAMLRRFIDPQKRLS